MNQEDIKNRIIEEGLFCGISNDLLVALLSNKVSIEDLAKKELQNRGFNEKGEWVGLK